MMRLIAAVGFLVAGCVWLPSVVAETARGSQLTMNQWIRLTANHALEGRVVVSARDGKATAVAGAEIRLRGADGAILSGTADSDGRFSIENVAPGIYTLVARSAETFATAALHVMSVDQRRSKGFPSLANISVAQIHQSTVAMAVQRYLPPQLSHKAPTMETAQLDALADRIVGSDLHQVAQVGGGLRGQIFVAGADGSELSTPSRTNVFVFRDGLEVARSLTDDQGRFKIDRLALGQYSLLAVGRDGIGSIGFVLVNEDLQQVRNQSKFGDSETLVARNDCCDIQQEFAMQIAPVADAVELVQGIPVEHCGPCGAPIPACGCGPCCGGIVEGAPIAQGAPSAEDAPLADGQPLENAPVADGGPLNGFGGGYAGYSGGGYGGFGGGGGGFAGGGGGGFGLGGLGALGGLGGVLAATANNSSSAPIVQPVIVSDNQPPQQPPSPTGNGNGNVNGSDDLNDEED